MQHHPPPLSTTRRMKTWTIVPSGTDFMPQSEGERIIKTSLGVARCCFKKKIIGRYPPSFPGRRHPAILLVSSLDLLSFFMPFLISMSHPTLRVPFLSPQQQTSEVATAPPNTVFSDQPHFITTILPIKRFRTYNKSFNNKPQKLIASNRRTNHSLLRVKR